MPLTDVAIRKAKAAEDKPYKLTDARSLYLLIKPNGSKLWQMKYSWLGKERLLSFGPYPTTSLSEARRLRDEAKLDLKNEIEPAAKVRTAKVAAKLASANTFGDLADELIARKKAEGSAPGSIKVYERILHTVLGPTFSKRAITSISSAEVLLFLKRLEAKGQIATASAARGYMGRVFKLAISTLRAEVDVTAPLVGATSRRIIENHPAIIDPKAFGGLLKAIDTYRGGPIVKSALQLSALNCLRPGELRLTTWANVDFESCILTIPEEVTKLRREFVSPLSLQAVSILRELKRLTGHHDFVFSSRKGPREAMHQSSMITALGIMGYDGDTHCAHGFRSSFSTLANEHEIGRWDVIEAHLDHRDKNTTRAVYNRASYWAERVKLAQDWADYCDALKAAA